MPLHRGTKTGAAGALAATSFGTMWVDPTGVSALTFLGASTATVLGTTYHAVKGITKHGSEAMDDVRRQRAEKQARSLRMTAEQHVQFQHEVENTIRRLTSSLEGTAVSGFLFIGLPYMGIIWAINAAEAGYEIRRLEMLADRAGGKRALVKTISKRNAAVQVATGAAIKTATISLTLGHDFDAAVTSIAGHVSDVDYNALLKDTGAAHEKWLEGDLVENTTKFIDEPQNFMKDYLERLEGDFDPATGPWSWEEGHSAEGVVALGATVAVVNKAVDYAVDNQLHGGAEVVGGSRKKE